METYSQLIDRARLISNTELEVTTGDVEYTGTAIEVSDEKGEEICHVVVDSGGEQQLLFFSCEKNFRVPLSEMQRILTMANQHVKQIEEL